MWSLFTVTARSRCSVDPREDHQLETSRETAAGGRGCDLFVFPGLVLVTDAIAAMGLPPGRHMLGQQVIEIQGLHAYVAGLTLFSLFQWTNK